jgi:hypothetical protein
MYKNFKFKMQKLLFGPVAKCYALEGVCHEISQVLFWHVWMDLGLYKNL